MAQRPEFGALLKRWREGKGLTQGAAAEQAGVSQPYWSAMERGTVPSLDVLESMITRLALPRDEVRDAAGTATDAPTVQFRCDERGQLTPNAEFAVLVARLLREAGLTLTEAARLTGIPKGDWYYLRQGVPPDSASMRHIADALGLSNPMRQRIATVASIPPQDLGLPEGANGPGADIEGDLAERLAALEQKVDEILGILKGSRGGAA